jgi:protein TonB
MKKEFENKQTALDILFEQKNKSYGAYALRQAYPNYMARALIYAFGMIGAFILLPLLLQSFSIHPGSDEKEVQVIACFEDIKVERVTPPVVVPPPPPKQVKTTIAFVPPIVRRDNEVGPDEGQIVDLIQKSDGEIGKITIQGTDEGPPTLDKIPDGLIDQPKVQTQKEDETFELFTVQKAPAFPGGEAELMKYLAENTKYPQFAKEYNIEGVVPISFVIDAKGNVVDAKVLREIGGGCGTEALRVIRSMPKWSPGEVNGRAVKVRYTIPIRFELN